MARVLPALLLLLCPFAYAQAPDALAALDDCARQLDAGLDVGYERIAARCPTLTRALEHSPWAAWLPPGWKEPHNQLNAEGLRALHSILARESTATPGSRVLHPERVPAVLERVARPDGAEQGGWWARLKRWLRELLTPQPQDERRWWRRLFGDGAIDRSVLRVVAVVAIGLLVIVALMVVTNELRVAGLLRRRRSGTPRGTVPGGGPRTPDLEAAERSAQPALLLELIATRLAAQQRLPPARALTVRELMVRARLRDAAERARLADLAAVSERLRYSGQGVAAAALEAALSGGRELLAALEASAATGAA